MTMADSAARSESAIGGRHLRDDVVHVAVGGLQPDEQRQQAQHAQADHDGAVADRGGQEGGLDQVFTHGEKALRNGLVADGIGQHGDEVRRTLLQDRLRGIEVGLVAVQAPHVCLQHVWSAGVEEDQRDDDDRSDDHRCQLREVGHDRGAEARPQGVGQHAQPGDQYALDERERAED
ncbi:hypothetical protein G6F35_016455 [Rhizopus arrhizus]|nr:hypothetical protein G6F35_016455 [Rhizopus arrhizus]